MCGALLRGTQLGWSLCERFLLEVAVTEIELFLSLCRSKISTRISFDEFDMEFLNDSRCCCDGNGKKRLNHFLLEIFISI